MAVTLGQLIQRLEKEDPNRIIALGFEKPHSNRGDYRNLGFEPVENARIGDMLAAAKSAVGRSFTGYKGGDFYMDESTECFLSRYGMCGEELGEHFLEVMLR